MIREKVSVSDFKKISTQNPIFIWHFLQKYQNQVPFSIQSYFDDLNILYNRQNQILPILEMVNIPYFESYVDESVDFLMDLGFSGSFLYKPKPNVFGVDHFKHYSPLIVGFKNGQKVNSTTDYCYCMEGVIDMIGNLDINLLEDLNL